MEKFINKKTSKKIVIAILLVMSFTFILPNVSKAVTLGDTLFKPISELLCFVADAVIGGLQWYFMDDGEIKVNNIFEENGVMYYIEYSPGVIFSDKVPGLDVNFFNPEDGKRTKVEYSYEELFTDKSGIENVYTYTVNDILVKAGYKEIEADSSDADTIDEVIDYEYFWYYEGEEEYNFTVGGNTYRIITTMSPTYSIRIENINNDAVVYFEEVELSSDIDNLRERCRTWLKDNLCAIDSDSSESQKVAEQYETLLREAENNIKKEGPKNNSYWALSDRIEIGNLELYLAYNYSTGEYKLLNSIRQITEVELESSASQLQPIVATWYKALRAIALVGLLSVLVYVGIRILISSTGQEKAKYKKMIGDWLAAICILFVLQYIMIFTLEIIDGITKMLSVNIMGEYGEDTLISGLRREINNGDTFNEIFPQLLIYLVLVIYTVMFTIQYLKRLLYMAFFTLIAPLIALTYPLDKIKDGQAQAFSTWLREYIFNALLQPMHLLLYYIFVSSAVSLVDTNPLYAVVAIGFMLPAEKFFRKMFGFDKAESSSQIGAAAGGALIMNAINKLGNKSGKQASGGDGGSGGSGSSTPRYVPAPGGNSGGGNPGGENPGGENPGGENPGGENPGGGNPGGGNPGGGNKTKLKDRPGIRGTKAVAGRFVKKGGKMLGKGLIGAAGAATLGTVGLAAGIATGNASNVLSYGLAGAGAGFVGANSLASGAVGLGKGAVNGAREIRDTYEEGAYGTDEHKMRSSVRELSKDPKFNEACDSLGVTDKEAFIRQCKDYGLEGENVTKAAQIAAKNQLNLETVGCLYKIRQQAERYRMTPEDIRQELNNRDLGQFADIIDKF